MKSDKDRTALSQTITVLLGYFGDNQQWERVTEVISYTKRIGLKLNVFQFTVLINIHCKTNQFDQVVEVFEEMKRSGVELDNASCCSLIGSLTKSSDPHHTEPLMEVWRNFKSTTTPTVANVGDFSTAIVGLLEWFAASERWEEVQDVVSFANRNAIRLDVDIFNTLLSGFGNANNPDAMYECLRTMVQGDAAAPDVVTWQIMIQHFTKPSLRPHVSQDDVVAVWEEWRQLAQWDNDSEQEHTLRTWVNLVQYFGSEEVSNWELVGSLEKWMLENFAQLQENNKHSALTVLEAVYKEAGRDEDVGA
eukprot:TRINITY_DN66886_c0_g1_i2.p1 TRINITY_DN66886_c0_g1~~TRINITY_DN66886_c0_g1_i2.p1  ORF type:complete len:317 (-),score=58.29 TRINITY_DN66886_c0_g1_i2:39-956(-)